ncbi:hypothetical protein BDW60DRAFT_203936 [Aspergillus nidulans var. acristatus]
MNISWLQDVDIDLRGNLLVRQSTWSTDIQYWLNNSLEVGYQNQSTAWILGGDNVRINIMYITANICKALGATFLRTAVGAPVDSNRQTV